MRFFRNFPVIKYDLDPHIARVISSHAGHTTISLRNIILKANILNSVLDKFDVFYPYIITEGERADTIAAHYYGDGSYAWLIYLANNMKDPHYSWPLDYADFISFVVKKYGDMPTAQSTIAHYKYTGLGGSETQEEIDRISWVMTEESYDLLDPPLNSGWTPVYAYDHEVEENDERRNIILIDNDYLSQLRKEISRLFI